MKILLIIILISSMFEVLNRIFYSKMIGVIGLERKRNKISTSFSILTLVRYLKNGPETEFLNDCEKLFNSLEKDTQYYTYTHGGILYYLKKSKKCKVLKYEKVKIKRMFLANLYIGKTTGLFRPVQYYNVWFSLQ